MKWNDEKYGQLVAEHRQRLFDRDECYDNNADEATDMLMYIPGLGAYIQRRFKVFDTTFKLAHDLAKGVDADVW